MANPLTYTEVDFALRTGGIPNMPLFCEELGALALSVPIVDVKSQRSANGIAVQVHFESEPLGSDMAAVNAAVAAHSDLDERKRAKFAAIDAKTDAIIAQGFVYSGKTFSLSIPAQSYWTNMEQAKDLLTYPLIVNTLDDKDTHSIADTTEVDAMYAAAIGTVQTALASGTTLKDSVRAATTVAEVDAVVDNR